MKALVIGASGHIGAHLTRVLLAAGYSVRALVRPTSRTQGLAGLPVEVAAGDLRDAASIGAAVRGCRFVFHLGAPTQMVPGIESIITDGTRNVLQQAHRSGVEKVVYTSSIVAVGYSSGPAVVLDETSNQL